jgi:FdhD protein
MEISRQSVTIQKYQGLQHHPAEDWLSIEEPLEIRLRYGPETDRIERPISITMRTPGKDAELALGFLVTEGILAAMGSAQVEQTNDSNVVVVNLPEGIQPKVASLERHFYTTSSCGVCGKTSIDALQACGAKNVHTPTTDLEASLIYQLPQALRTSQADFEWTGGLHAAALFDANGQLLLVREDVGRHNALDKLIGAAYLEQKLPLDQTILLLSGRASFELLQKAAMAGISTVCAVGAPSSLAVQTAREFGIRLIGFLRENRFNLYT